MPVRKLVRAPRGPGADALKARLVAEWRDPASAAPQPVILEEGGGPNQPVHVYVIWDDWAGVSQVERSEVIMDAFEEQFGQARAVNVTVAMGLTPDEAGRLGIHYQ